MCERQASRQTYWHAVSIARDTLKSPFLYPRKINHRKSLHELYFYNVQQKKEKKETENTDMMLWWEGWLKKH